MRGDGRFGGDWGQGCSTDVTRLDYLGHETGTATGGLAKKVSSTRFLVATVSSARFLARVWVACAEFAPDTMVAVAPGHYCRPRWWNEGNS